MSYLFLMHNGSYNSSDFAAPLGLTCIAAYTLIAFCAHVATTRGIVQIVWLIIGALVAGTAIAMSQLLVFRAMPLSHSNAQEWPLLLLIYAADILGACVILVYGQWAHHRPLATAAAAFLLGSTLVLGHILGFDKVISLSSTAYSTYTSVILLLLLGVVASYIVLKTTAVLAQPEYATLWKRVSGALLLGLVITAVFLGGFEAAEPVMASIPGLPSHNLLNISTMELYEAAVFSFLLLLFALAAISLDHRVSVQTESLESNAVLHRMTTALSEQRAVRVQNEALTEEMAERQKAESRLLHVAFHDSVTQLHNRSYFMESLAEALKQVQGNKKSRWALLYIDLDNFKSVNDMFGHRIGDLLLLEIARRLQSCSRERDVLARLQGDEFTLLFANPRSMEQVIRMGERILTLIEEPISLAGAMLPITASIGVCRVSESAAEAAEILRDADTAMYEAKRQGGSRCVLYNSAMHEEAIAELQAKLELKAAVEHEEFELYYQPLVRMEDASIYGMEALIRWNHPVRGLVSPAEFIPLAETTGHICAIGNWVLRQGCKDFKRFREVYAGPLLLSLNVSSQQLDEPVFFSYLTSVLTEAGMTPTSLQLELTESVLLKDAARLGGLFREIRALGVKIAFDDFGTGYSSLSYLQRYPIDTLKIDQSFVQNMGKGSANADIVKFVIELAHVTGMEVSAEGIEEPEQALALLERGCSVAQGYLYSRPIPLAAMIDILKFGTKLSKSNVAIKQAIPTLIRATS